jgi:hypothetical protein
MLTKLLLPRHQVTLSHRYCPYRICTSPCSFIPPVPVLCAHLFPLRSPHTCLSSPHSFVPSMLVCTPCSFIPPMLALCLFVPPTLVHTPCARSPPPHLFIPPLLLLLLLPLQLLPLGLCSFQSDPTCLCIHIGHAYTHPSSLLFLVCVCPPLGLCVPTSLLSEHHYLL